MLKSAGLLQWVVFIEATYGPPFFSFIQLKTDVQNILEMTEHRPKQNRRPKSRKHTKDYLFGYLGVFNLDFLGHYETFFRNIFDCTKGSPFNFCFDILQPFSNKTDGKNMAPLLLFSAL